MIELAGRLDAGRLSAGLARRVRVFVDGDQPRGVVACDTHEGWADCRWRDERGRFVTAAGVAVLTRLRGRVRVFVDRLDPDELRRLEGRA